MKKILVTSIFLGLINFLHADCIYKGVVYPEGAKIGSLTCINGQWVRR